MCELGIPEKKERIFLDSEISQMINLKQVALYRFKPVRYVVGFGCKSRNDISKGGE